ncbi:protein ALTERED PHOSPHATE STARVATION RESPONSE 1-like [Impatiens glandulifera]|uniref:protein ALTERED PHOSPHATE STARVATION RESPONSE 1-like n=1 Tax=Impatiens glandulifera TaxID=253017 RepID=UPI001FB08E85|nr:protein ALTERED PHOSPHATE STARVATION RESPONSE 1-like [Impatiens glandulifera]
MGNCNCRITREEMVSRCKARKRYMKQLVEARQSYSTSHSIYIRSLRNTGSALLQFATTEINHHLPPPPPNNPTSPPPPPPPMSPIVTPSSTWTIPTVLPPPPPQPAVVSGWDFWDQFIMPPSSSRSETEEEWEMSTTTTGSETTVAAPPTGELAVVVVSCKRNELFEIMKELDECFINAANAGASLSSLLEVSYCNFHPSPASGKNIYGHEKGSSSPIWPWGSCRKTDDSILNIFERNQGEEEGCVGVGSHSSTVEKLYVWEKKLYSEVKNSETLKGELEKKTAQLKKLEINRAEHVKTKKIRNEVEKLESILMVSSQSIETISSEIIKLRETNLYPQLVELVKRSMDMWRTMYESHQIQTQIVKNLKNLNINTIVPSTDSTSEIHQQSTLHLEQELHQWHISFNNLVNSQRDYIQALAGWLRLSLFPLSKTGQDSSIYSLCEELHLAINRVPDKVASEGIKSLLNVIRDVVVQQGEELKQRKRSELVDKHLEKKLADLKIMEESKKKDRVSIKQEKVGAWKAKADEERIRHERLVGVTRATTVNNLQMGLPQVFEAMMGFSNVCIHVYESVYNRAKITLDGNEVKKL